MMRGTTALAVAAALVACAGPTSHEPPEADGDPSPATAPALEAAPGEPFTLAPGEAATVEAAGLTVRFLEVTEDSRCPTDVTCVWEGDAAVALETVRGGVERAWLLHAPGERVGPRWVEVDGWRLELIELEPQPVSDGPIPAEDYRATFVVR